MGPGAQGERATRGVTRADWGAGWAGGARALKRGRALLAAGAGPGLSWWASGMGFGLGCFGFGFSFSFYFFSFLNLIQTKFEFKYKFEFKPHSIKSMHQHECNINFFKLRQNFNYLRNKIKLNASLTQ